MKDLNFFDSYIVKRKPDIDRQNIYYFLILTLIIGIGINAIFNQIRINRMLMEVTKIKNVVEDDRVKDKINEVNIKQDELEHLREKLNELELFNSFIEENSKINDILFEILTASIPDGVFLTSISAYSNEVNIIGKSQEQLLIAQLVENIESFQVFKRVFVSSITKEEKFFSFMLNISLKDVNTGGENTTNTEEANN